MNAQRIIVLVALLCPGCSKLNPSFAEDTDGATSTSGTTPAMTETSPTSPGSSNAAGSDTVDPKPPESSGPVPDPSGADSATSNASDSTPGFTTGPDSDDSGDSGDGPECSGPSGPCVPFGGDCPTGERCRPYDGSGAGSFSGFGCFPRLRATDERPCDDACGRLSGWDSCPAEALCDPIEAPECLQICQVDAGCEIGFCDTEDFPGMNFGLCRADCNPFDQDCPNDELCLPDGEEMICLEPAGELGPGVPCASLNDCSAGLICAPSDKLSECQGLPCCTEICELEADDCPSGFACDPIDGKSTSHTAVGVCIETF